MPPDWQPETGNVVIANSELVDGTITYGQILEVTPDGTRVFELNVRGTAARSVHAIYRVERLADIRR